MPACGRGVAQGQAALGEVGLLSQPLKEPAEVRTVAKPRCGFLWSSWRSCQVPCPFLPLLGHLPPLLSFLGFLLYLSPTLSLLFSLTTFGAELTALCGHLGTLF